MLVKGWLNASQSESFVWLELKLQAKGQPSCIVPVVKLQARARAGRMQASLRASCGWREICRPDMCQTKERLMAVCALHDICRPGHALAEHKPAL